MPFLPVFFVKALHMYVIILYTKCWLGMLAPKSAAKVKKSLKLKHQNV